MSSQHKTFVDNAVLTAAEINNNLNPTTADHIPYAAAAGALSAGFASQFRSRITVNLPSGRFTVAPVAMAAVSSQDCYVTVVSATSTTVTIDVTRRDFVAWTGTIYGSWIALQMTATAANG